MEPLVGGSPLLFTVIKFGLTSAGMTLLILLARTRVFGRLPVSFLLYSVLFAYSALVAYEFWLLETIFSAPEPL